MASEKMQAAENSARWSLFEVS